MDGSTPNFICVGIMSADVPLPPLRSIGRWGRVEGELKTQKWGVVSFVQWTATIFIFLSASNCGSICRAETCAHSGVEPSTSAKAILQCGPKRSKKIQIFHYFDTSRPYISETIYKNLAIANRSRVSCTHNSSRASP